MIAQVGSEQNLRPQIGLKPDGYLMSIDGSHDGKTLTRASPKLITAPKRCGVLAPQLFSHTVQSDTTRCGVSRVGHVAKRPR
jgi:hypothetical protein